MHIKPNNTALSLNI